MSVVFAGPDKDIVVSRSGTDTDAGAVTVLLYDRTAQRPSDVHSS
jgi:hypothetical protein